MTDIAGPTALANSKGSVIAAEMAAEGFGAGLNVEVISADHSGKPDTGSQIAALVRLEGVDAIADVQDSPIGSEDQCTGVVRGCDKTFSSAALTRVQRNIRTPENWP